MPMAMSLETPFLRATTASKSSSPTVSFRPKSPALRAVSSRAPACIQTLLGMQPRRTQVPPMALASTMATLPLSWDARMAAA